MSTVQSTPDRKIVIAFVHGLEPLLNNKHIPSSIIELCLKFYSLNKDLFVQYWTIYKNYGVQRFGILNLSGQKFTNLMVSKKMLKSKYVFSKKRPIHIANIGNLLNSLSPQIRNELDLDFGCNSYDAFFGIAMDTTYMSMSQANNDTHKIFYPFFAIYEPGYDEYTLKMFISERKFSKMENGLFLYCGAEHGIICYKEWRLYQLKLQNIKNENFGFEELCVASNVFDKILYLENEQCIFCVYVSRSDKTLKCSLYDLNSKQWSHCPIFRGWNLSPLWDICYDGKGKVHFVSMNSKSEGVVSVVYDLKEKFKNWTKWPVIMMRKELETSTSNASYSGLRIWIDGDRLYSAVRIAEDDVIEISEWGFRNDKLVWNEWEKHKIAEPIAKKKWCFF